MSFRIAGVPNGRYLSTKTQFIIGLVASILWLIANIIIAVACLVNGAGEFYWGMAWIFYPSQIVLIFITYVKYRELKTKGNLHWEDRPRSWYEKRMLREIRLEAEEMALERWKAEKIEIILIRNKFLKMLHKRREILEAIMKIDEEYEKLLDRKNAGESFAHLILENRREKERLNKEHKENGEIIRKWERSGEGKRVFKAMAMDKTMTLMNPIMQIKNELRLKIIDFENKIKEKEQENVELVKRNNKEEYVDDLIKKNRTMARGLEKDKKKFEATLADLESIERSE